MSGIHSENPL